MLKNTVIQLTMDLSMQLSEKLSQKFNVNINCSIMSHLDLLLYICEK